MEKRIIEAEKKLTINVQALLAALAVGAISALVCIGFRLILRFLQWVFTGNVGLLSEAAAHLNPWRRILMPVTGAILATLVTSWSRRIASKDEATDYIEAVRFEHGCLSFAATARRSIASCFSIASGAAIGREGSMIQFAASCVSSAWQRIGTDSLTLENAVCCAVAGAVASVYNAPIAGIFFAIEIVLGLHLFVRKAWIQVPTLSAAVIGAAVVSRLLLNAKPLFAPVPPIVFHWTDIFGVAACAVLIGTLGPVYFHLVKGARFLKSLPWPMVWSGAAVGLLSCLQTDTWGNGDSAVLKVMAASVPVGTIAAILLIRLVATSACVGSGVVGGVFTPTVFAGAAVGLFCGHALQFLPIHTSPQISYAVLAIACLLASVTHAPCMATFMAAELTGTAEWLWVVAPACFISFRISTWLSGSSLYAVATQDASKLSPQRKPQIASPTLQAQA